MTAGWCKKLGWLSYERQSVNGNKEDEKILKFIILLLRKIFVCNFIVVSKKKKFCLCLMAPITKTRRYSFDPLKLHFYIVKLGFTGVYIIFIITAQKHRLRVLFSTASARRFKRVPTIYVLSRNMKTYQIFFNLKTFNFWW